MKTYKVPWRWINYDVSVQQFWKFPSLFYTTYCSLVRVPFNQTNVSICFLNAVTSLLSVKKTRFYSALAACHAASSAIIPSGFWCWPFCPHRFCLLFSSEEQLFASFNTDWRMARASLIDPSFIFVFVSNTWRTTNPYAHPVSPASWVLK